MNAIPDSIRNVCSVKWRFFEGGYGVDPDGGAFHSHPSVWRYQCIIPVGEDESRGQGETIDGSIIDAIQFLIWKLGSYHRLEEYNNEMKQWVADLAENKQLYQDLSEILLSMVTGEPNVVRVAAERMGIDIPLENYVRLEKNRVIWSPDGLSWDK